MDNLDSEIIEWVSKALLTKGGAGSGEQPGHPFRGNQYTAGSGGERGLLESSAAHEASSRSHAEWVKGDMKYNSPFTTRILGQRQVPVGAHLERPASKAAVKADELARQGDHKGAADAYREAQANTYGERVWEGRGVDGQDVVMPASREWEMAQEAATHHDELAKVGKSASEIQKGDLPGHEFHGNQYTHGQAASDLRDLAASARAANEKSRLKTDVLGVSGARNDKSGNYNRSVPTYSTPRYEQSQTENAKDHNRAIAGHAEALAQAIESDPSKSVEQHIADFRDNVASLRSQGQFHTSVDNYDTGSHYYRAANAGSAVADHISQNLKPAEIQKGDFAGHPFRGNQWSAASSGIEGNNLSERAENLHRDTMSGGAHGDYERVDEHINLANDHQAIADALRARGESQPHESEGRLTDLLAASAHQTAADAHTNAAFSANDAIEAANADNVGIGDSETADKAHDTAIRDSEWAADFSRRAEKYAPSHNLP